MYVPTHCSKCSSLTSLPGNVKPASASGKCDFEAGDTVTIEMHQQSNSRNCKEEGIGGAHWGPVLAYMSKVEDAATADGSSEFFKVYQNGWKKNPAATQGDNDFWGTKDLNYNCGKLDFKIPSDLPSGDYLLRAEAIALHAASQSGGAQHYVTCYQLTVKGSGSAVPKGVKFPEAYSKTGPGLGFSIHQDMKDYPMPGPALIASGTESAPQLLTFGTITGSPAAGAPAPAKSSTAAVAPSSAAPKTSAAATSAAAAASSVVEAKPTTAAPKPTAAPAPAPGNSADKEFTLAEFTAWLAAQPGADKEYTMKEFIAWLEKASTEEPAASEVAAPAPAPTAAPSSKKPSTTLATSVRASPSAGAGDAVAAKEYAQCGGQGFTGPKSCAAGLVCKEQNPYYSQCIKSGNQPDAAPTATAAKPVKEPTKVPAVTKEAVTKTAPASAPTGAADKEYTLNEFIAFLEEAEKSL